MATFNPDLLPAEYRESYNDLSESGKAAWLEQRLKGQIDHLFLGNELMGYDFQPNPHEKLFAELLQKDPEQLKPLHLLDPKTKKRMVLWPRGLFKTSAIVVEIVQLILNYPNIRILFLSGSKKLALRQVNRVRQVFEKPTEKFRQLYPEFCAAKGKKLQSVDNGEGFIIPCRTLTQFAEPTLCISSAKSVNASTHFDVIFCDDLVNEQNYKKPKQLEAVWEEYCSIGPLLEPAGYMFVTGTRYAFGDTYERIAEQAAKDQKELGKTVWKVSAQACWTIKCATCGHDDVNHNSDLSYTRPPCTMPDCKCECFVDSGEKKLLFPLATTRDGRQVGHTVEYLEFERREKGDQFFANQYLNRPVPKEEQRFTPELITRQTFFNLSEMPLAGATFMVGDLSYPGDEKRDKSVLYLVKVWMGVLWVYHCIAGNWDSDQVCQIILNAILEHRPQHVWLEGFLGWDAYNNILASKAAAVGLLQLPVTWRKLDRRPEAKTKRIGGSLPWLKDRKLFLYGLMPEYDKLTNQLKKWPSIPHHDDHGDCLGHVCEVPHGAAGVPAVQQNYSAIDYVRQLHAEAVDRQMADQYAGGGTGTGIVSG